MQSTKSRSCVWGILGGMGPIASAEFLKTVYERAAGGLEQNTPAVIVISDPGIPDRTELLLSGREDILQESLVQYVQDLVSFGALKIVICCVTAHGLISRFPRPLQARIISLVDLVFSSVRQSGRAHLLLCTNGSRRTGVFEQNNAWSKLKDQIVVPDAGDQEQIHNLIYSVKRNQHNVKDCQVLLQRLLTKYGVASYIAGCTELHILVKQQEQASGRTHDEFAIDPLMAVAAMMSRRPNPALESLHATLSA